MEPSNEITWRSGTGYSPVQNRRGVTAPSVADLPPATRRVSQVPDPYATEFLDQREILRVTYQGDDRCQLACPGCYTGTRLRQPVTKAGRKVVPWVDFTGQLAGLGSGLQDFFLLGAEATVDPAGSAAKLEHARRRGLPLQIITHGAVSVDRFEATFGAALDSGAVHKLIISLDSMNPQVNNILRGRGYAHRRTLEIIRHCLARQVPFKVQMTVWPLNYPTIHDSVEQLFRLGVRGFSFHCGSLEGITDPDAHGLDRVDPLAWRALVEQLLSFRDAHRDQLWTFNLPYLFVTGEELETYVIGDVDLTAAYLAHRQAVERGRPSTKPVHACPALDVPQVYVYGNDSPAGSGTVSLCNVHTDPHADAYADYDPAVRRWRVRTDPSRNQLQALADSPYLCPATPYALNSDTDRFDTEVGPLFHVCRYLGCGQMPADLATFGPRIYRDACDLYRQVSRALSTYPRPDESGRWPTARIRHLTSRTATLAGRARALRADLDRHHPPHQQPPPRATPPAGPGTRRLPMAQ